MHIYYFSFCFFIYGLIGWCAEVAFAAMKQKTFVNRGFLNGPICPIYGIGVGVVVQFLPPFSQNLFMLYLTSTVLVTFIEWLTGVMLDKLFHHKWWDYSTQPLNIGGYVCLPFSLIWGVACVFIVLVLHPLIDRGIRFIPHIVGLLILLVLMAVLCADLSVTVAGILKFNRRLEAMGKVAQELRELSDKMGANIYENVVETMEKLETVTEEQKIRAEELKERTAELKLRYESLAEKKSRVGERLMQAFPRMESRHHKDILNELKELIKKGK